MRSSSGAKQRSLILASRSPRRVELLRAAGFEFEIDPADIDEDDFPKSLDPSHVARLLALRKAERVADRHANSIVLAADTVVAAKGQLYGKADTPEAARNMLIELAGEQQVITAVVVMDRSRNIQRIDHAVSIVLMRRMSSAELDDYLASNQWRGKAGAYGIQDVEPHNDPFVRIVEGEYDNVVGLPIKLVAPMLSDLV